MNLLGILQDFALLCVVFVPLERLFARRPEQRIFRRGWTVDLLHVFVSGFLIRLGGMVLIALTVGLLSGLVPPAARAAIAAQPLWLAFVEILVIADLGFYLAHRAFHAVPWLWRFHAVHHSIEEMDFLAAHRVHPFDQILTRGATMLPIFILGFAPEPILLFSFVYHWQSVLIHANTRIGIGPLRWLIASPIYHHWHHANHTEAVDRNFAGQLPIIDFVFGTLYLPTGETPKRYGIDMPVPDSYLGQLAHPFRRVAGSIGLPGRVR